jgi:hypothetical protein
MARKREQSRKRVRRRTAATIGRRGAPRTWLLLMTTLLLCWTEPGLAETVSDTADGGWGIVETGHGGDVLLSGFHLEFLPQQTCSVPIICGVGEVDHQIWVINVNINTGAGPSEYFFAYMDAGQNDKYAYAARFHGRQPHSVNVTTERCGPELSGPCRLSLEGADDPLVPPHKRRFFVLAGFQLAFTEEQDEEVWKIRIQQRGAEVEVDFGQQTGDGGPSHEFAAKVWYVWVEPEKIQDIGTAAGTTPVGAGSAVAPVPAGDVVLRGFSVEFAGGEHHELTEFGILAPGIHTDEHSVSFSDKDRAEQVHWRVDWAVLGQRLIKTDVPGGPVNAIDMGP